MDEAAPVTGVARATRDRLAAGERLADINGLNPARFLPPETPAPDRQASG
jgi:hypothetical protein